jgi:AcrR family transcriptional regulator
MSPQDRRNQLLDLGVPLFAELPYDDVFVERVAEAAGVSRGLLYHYFPTKRDFFLQLLQRESDRLLEQTAPDPNSPLREQLLQGVERYLDHYRDNRHGVVAVVRGSASGDVEIQRVVQGGAARQAARIVETLCAGAEPHPLLGMTVRGWLEFLRSLALDWLTQDTEGTEDTENTGGTENTENTGGAPGADRDEVRDLAAATLIGALLALPAHAQPVGLAWLQD